MKRKVALDVGDVRIGVAVSDMLGITANPRETYVRKGKTVAVLISIICKFLWKTVKAYTIMLNIVYYLYGILNYILYYIILVIKGSD